MKYWTRRNGSQRASQTYKVETLEVLGELGGSYEPVLLIRVDGIWHAIEFENSGEARVLMSCAAKIFQATER